MALPTSNNNVTVRKLSSTLNSYNTKVNTKLGGKADKVSNATSGHLASLDGNGNIDDSGKAASDFVEKSAGVTNVGYDTTNKKITKTINGTTTDVVSASTLKTDMALNNVTNDAQVKRSEMGVANGVATLDSNGKIPSAQIPGSYDDVKEGYLYNGSFYYDAEHTQEITPASDMVYVDKSTNKTYRWSGTQYVVIGSDLALGETSSTAYRGDRGKVAYDFSQDPYTSNPAMNGTASSGSSTKWAKGDHVHPSDTSREAVANKKTSWSSTVSDTNYPSEKLVKDSLDNKVDKVSGKGLSTNDYTTADKDKLAGISTGANKVQSSSTNGNIKIDGTETTVYTHPTTTAASAAAVKVGKDANGHVVLGSALAKGDVGLGNVDNTSDSTKKTNFTGSVASGNTGFPTGGAVFDAIAANGKGVAIFNVDPNASTGNPTWSDISAALDAGKLPIAKITVSGSGASYFNYYVFVGKSNNDGVARFTSVHGLSIGTLELKTSTGVWTGSVEKAENNDNKVSSWSGTPTDTNYPSEKLVYDSLSANGKGVAFFDVTIGGSGNPTYADIAAAYNAGKLVVVNKFCVLEYADDSEYRFFGALTTTTMGEKHPTVQNYTVSSDGTWTSDIVIAASDSHTHDFFGAFCYCSSTTNSSAAFSASNSDYKLVKNGIVSVKFSAAVPASATLNINSKGAKSIYYGTSAIAAGVIQQGDTATFIYDGSHYVLLAVDRSITEMTDTEVTDLVNALT